MPPADGQRPPLYPAFCFNLSPTYNTWVRMRAVDVHKLQEHRGFEGQNLFFYQNHPVQYVRLVGVVVAFDVLDTRFVFAIDDSSGSTIDVACDRPKPALPNPGHAQDTAYDIKSFMTEIPKKGLTKSRKEIDLSGIDVGTVVKIKGFVNLWWEEKQIRLERLWIVHDTSEEIAAWEETQQFLTDVLSKPWVLTDRERRHAERKMKSVNGRSDRCRSGRNPGSATARAREGYKREKLIERGSRAVSENESMGAKAQMRERERQEREKALQERRRERAKENALLLQGQTKSEQSGSVDDAIVKSQSPQRSHNSSFGDAAAEIAMARRIEREHREQLLREKTERSRSDPLPRTCTPNDTNKENTVHDDASAGKTTEMEDFEHPRDVNEARDRQAQQRRAAEKALRERRYRQKFETKETF